MKAFCSSKWPGCAAHSPGCEELCQREGTRAPAKTAASSEVGGEDVNENPGTAEPLVPGFQNLKF